jgi:hypothetical protein
MGHNLGEVRNHGTLRCCTTGTSCEAQLHDKKSAAIHCSSGTYTLFMKAQVAHGVGPNAVEKLKVRKTLV